MRDGVAIPSRGAHHRAARSMGHLADTLDCLWLPLPRPLSCTWTSDLQMHTADDARLHNDKSGLWRERLYELGNQSRDAFRKCEMWASLQVLI